LPKKNQKVYQLVLKDMQKTYQNSDDLSSTIEEQDITIEDS
jgi:hypothetical protein